MGIPYHFAIDIPKRCYQLLCDHWETVEAKSYEDFDGPLATTFLVAMAAQILSFPYERIAKTEKHPAKIEHVLTKKMADAILDELNHPHLADTAFFKPGAWRYQFLPANMDIRITELPDHVLAGFANADTLEAAAALPTWVWIGALRNATAHSSVAYLNDQGQQVAKSAVHAIAFAGEKTNGDQRGHHVLVISRDDFRGFIDSWMTWLTS